MTKLQINNFMIAKHLQKMNHLLNRAKTEAQSQQDSIALISTNMARTTKTSQKTRSKSFVSHKILFKTHEVDRELEGVLRQLFKAKCADLKIEVNKRSWQMFIKTFVIKNKIQDGKIVSDSLNLAHFSLTPSCLPFVNRIIELSSFKAVILSKNLINPTLINSLTTIKQLVLNNCRLGNDILEYMFEQLLKSSIVKISLSSPQLKDRNQLTRYQKLITLINKSKSLQTLLLCNIEIQPDSGLMESLKHSNIKHLDVSDNTNVRGISPVLLSLNLSRNSITNPFDLPLPVCQIQSLNLSYNKIPFYLFKSFLKVNYLPALSHLVLDHIQLNGSIYPIQQFIENSLSLTHLSLVECDLTFDSYLNIANGVRGSHNLKMLDLSRNRVAFEGVAQALGKMLQGGPLTHLRMRHCDLKDHIGQIIFSNIRKGYAIQSLDVMNNLLGDLTALTLCKELKTAKNIMEIKLDQNIIKYRDQQQIDGYLSSNRYTGNSNIDAQYRQCKQINKQQEDIERKLAEQEKQYQKLQTQTSQLEHQYAQKFRVSLVEKKQSLKTKINQLRQIESSLQQQLFIRESLMVPNMELSLEDKESSFNQNPQILIASPGR